VHNRIAKRLRLYALILASVLAGSTFGFMLAEGMGFVDALYFSVVTVATVGYGDLHPVTDAGKLLAVAVIITGVGTFLSVLANGAELLLERRQEVFRRERVNMLVGLFFSEIGTRLMAYCVGSDPGASEAACELRADGDWGEDEFDRAERCIAAHLYRVEAVRLDFDGMRSFLDGKSDLLLRLLENPNLVEHESFTNLLRAVFHLREELTGRERFGALPRTDREHLAGDVLRVYTILVAAWLAHLRYLRKNYPYLYSLAVRTNPFLERPSAVIAE
jgi:hypothetical protein